MEANTHQTTPASTEKPPFPERGFSEPQMQVPASELPAGAEGPAEVTSPAPPELTVTHPGGKGSAIDDPFSDQQASRPLPRTPSLLPRPIYQSLRDAAVPRIVSPAAKQRAASPALSAVAAPPPPPPRPLDHIPASGDMPIPPVVAEQAHAAAPATDTAFDASGVLNSGSPVTNASVTKASDPLRYSRFLSFPARASQNSSSSSVHLFDGLVNHNMHEITLTARGYYGIKLQNSSDAAWDTIYLGIGRMKAVASYTVVQPPPCPVPPTAQRRSTTKTHPPEAPKLSVEEPSAHKDSAIPPPSAAAVRVPSEIQSEPPGVDQAGCTEDSGSSGAEPDSQQDDSQPESSPLPQIGATTPENSPSSSSSPSADGDSPPPPLPASSVKKVPPLRSPSSAERLGPAISSSISMAPPASSRSRKAEDHRHPQKPVFAEAGSPLPQDNNEDAVSVNQNSGQLVCRAQQERVTYFLVPSVPMILKLEVYASFTLGMRLQCSYDLVYCGAPVNSPTNTLVPFLRQPNILCLDGGGVLGISSLKILERLELEVQKEVSDASVRLIDCFDMICGTSTGGIISLGLLAGLSVKDMINQWSGMSGRIFDGSRTLFSGVFFEGYDVARLKNALIQSLGERFLNTYAYPYCCVTSTDVKHNPYELFLLRNYTHNFLASNEHRGGCAVPNWVAAWATSAAPTYLKGPSPEELEKMGLIIHPEVQLCDGAMKANNPTMVALEEAARLSGKRLRQFIENDLDVLLSVGTGQPTLRQTIEKPGIVSTFQILLNSAHLLTSATTVHRDVLHWLGDHEDRYFRFNVPGIGDIPLDAIDRKSFDLIIKATNDYLSDEKYFDIKRLVRRLGARIRTEAATSEAK